MGLGFTLTLVLMGSVRELLGAGTLFGVRPCCAASCEPMTLFITPPGGFFWCSACLMALVIVHRDKDWATASRA